MNKILIGIPTRGCDIHYKLVEFLLGLEASTSFNVNVKFGQSGLSAGEAQWLVFEEMLKGDYTHFLYIDSDISPVEHSLDLLIEADKDIVAAPVWYYDYRLKDIHLGVQINIEDNERMYSANEKRGIEKVYFPGLSYTLMKRRVFKVFKDKGESMCKWSNILHESYKYRTSDHILFGKIWALGIEAWVNWDINNTLHTRRVDLCSETLITFAYRNRFLHNGGVR